MGGRQSPIEGTSGHPARHYLPQTGPFVPGVKVTPEFDPLVLKKNSGVIYVGIQYLVVFSGVTFTPVLGIQKNIISCVVRAYPRQAKVHNFTAFSGVTFTPAIWTSPLDCPFATKEHEGP